MIRLLLAALLLAAFTSEGQSQEWRELTVRQLQDQSADMWEGMSMASQEGFAVGWMLAMEAIELELEVAGEEYAAELVDHYGIRDAEEVWHIPSLINEVYDEAPAYRHMPVGLVAHFRHAFVERIRSGDRQPFNPWED